MKPRYLYLFVFGLLFTSNSDAQNLVTNGSFEDYTSCPTAQGEVYLTSNWITPTSLGSSDLFNPCADASTLVSAPVNGFGYQPAHTGNGYAGIFGAQGYRFTGLGGLYVREYIQTKLTDSMLPGRRYRVSYFISLAEYSCISISRIGACLSATPISSIGYIIADTPQVTDITGDFLTDTVSWHKMEGIYTATGGEQYITIGNFDTEANIQQISLPTTVINSTDPVYKSAYYYIDDVSVELISNDTTTTKPSPTVLLIPNVFSPNEDNANDDFKIKATGYSNYQLTIYNRWGQQVFESNDVNNSWNGKINNTNAPTGTYYYVLTLTDATAQTKVNKGFLTLVR